MDNVVKHLLVFGPFRLDSGQRLLLRDLQPIPLSPKAFDLLLVLVQRSGQLVLKDDLMQILWPDTFVEESNLGQHVFQLRKALGETAQDSSYIVTVPGRGYRFAQKVQVVDEEEEDKLVVESHSRTRMVIEEQSIPEAKLLPPRKSGLSSAIVLVTLLAVVGAFAVYFYTHRTRKLTSRDTVVLADFTNSTGDAVFDDALRQGLSAQLEQSPFLNLLSDSRIAQTLSLMTQPKASRLTPELAQEVCQRTASAAVLNPSIAQIGTRYLLALKAISCSTGESLASTEAQAGDKNHVLDALGRVGTEIRAKLGESLASVQKYDVPPSDVTTPSLEALHTYSLAMKARTYDFSTPIQIMHHAIEQDPNFAMAYAQLGVMYVNISETERGAENIRKAYALRDRVSEREKLYISSHYDQMVTGDLRAARKDYELWAQIYPRDIAPPANLGVICFHLGDFPKLFSYTQKAISLGPSSKGEHSANEIWTYLLLNRIDEAKEMALAEERNPDETSHHLVLYQIYFLQRDFASMKRELDALVGNATWGDAALNIEANSSAYFGQITRGREFTRRAVEAARKADKPEAAAAYQAEAAIAEALTGSQALSLQRAKTALALSNSNDIEAMSALAFSLAGDDADASRLATDLDRRFPQNTILQLNYLPTIRAATELWNTRGRGNAQKAIQILDPVAPYELGITALSEGLSLYPVFVRGEAYLAAKNGAAAALEFQKIIDHAGVVQNEPIGALAHLGLGRAYALSHDSAKAKIEYQNFLNLWKDAEPNIPILKAAKAEYAKLE